MDSPRCLALWPGVINLGQGIECKGVTVFSIPSRFRPFP